MKTYDEVHLSILKDMAYLYLDLYGSSLLNDDQDLDMSNALFGYALLIGIWTDADTDTTSRCNDDVRVEVLIDKIESVGKPYKHPITGERMTKKDYFNFMFGEEFMESEDKGTLKEYRDDTPSRSVDE